MSAPATVSAAWPLNVALAAAIDTARADPSTVLGSPIDLGDPDAVPPTEDGPIALDAPAVYSGQVPENTPIVSAYIVLSGSQEVAGRGLFRRRGHTNVETIDVWTADTSKRTALIIAGALRVLFDRVDLALEGYGTIRGRCETVLTVADPTTKAYRAQLRYTADSFNPIPAP